MVYRNATQTLKEACSGMESGQMVSVPGFTLMDLMSAIQIMDVRMDSGISLPPSDLPPTERVAPHAPFRFSQTPSVTDIIYILDRLLACETAFHCGAALSQTIYTCLYFHEIKRINTHPDPLVHLVLRAYILATIKTTEIAYRELTKQNVYDGEDFYGDSAGLSLLEEMESNYAIAQVEAALSYLSWHSHSAALTSRLQFRKQLLYAAWLLDSRDPSNLLEVTLHCKFARRHLDSISLCDPSRSKAPSVEAMNAFDPTYTRKLMASAPLRAISLPPSEQSRAFWEGLLQGMNEVVQMVQNPSVLGWKMFLATKAYGFQKEPTAPYVRSLIQSWICERNLVAGQLPLDWLTETFFQEVSYVDPLLLRRLCRISHSTIQGGTHLAWNAPPTLGQSISSFTQRISGYLVNYLSTLSQNRSRQKRSLAKSYAQWVAISEEASDLSRKLEAILRPEELVPDSLFASIQHLALDVMGHILFAGFELDLYRSDEWEGIYWLAGKVSAEQAMVCQDLGEAVGKVGYLTSQKLLAGALEQMCLGTISMLRNGEKTQSWPLLDSDDSRATLARATFARRIKWIALPWRPESRTQIHVLWDEFMAYTPEEAKHHFVAAIEQLETYASLPADSTRTSLCGDSQSAVSPFSL